MINLKSLVTLGIGFGALAISSFGIVGQEQNIPEQPPIVSNVYGGGGGTRYTKSTQYQYNPFLKIPITRDCPISITISTNRSSPEEKIYIINPLPLGSFVEVTSINRITYTVFVDNIDVKYT